MTRRWDAKDEWVLRVFPFVRWRRLSPDALTLLGVVLSGAVGAAYFYDRPVLAGLILLVAGWCDLVDGVVARLHDAASLSGGFLDSTLDRLSDLLLFGGIALGATTRADLPLALLSFWALGAAVLTSYSRARAECHLHSLELGFMDRGLRCVVLIAGSLSGWLAPALGVIGIGATWTAARRVWVARRHLDTLERSGVDPTRPPSPDAPAEPDG